jgi:hypothetical protein
VVGGGEREGAGGIYSGSWQAGEEEHEVMAGRVGPGARGLAGHACGPGGTTCLPSVSMCFHRTYVCVCAVC